MKMVRKHNTSKRALESCRIVPRITRSNSTASENIKNTSSKIIKTTQIKSKVNLHAKKLPENLTKKITRSKSVNGETVKSDENTCSLPNFSPKRTRSKSEKISNIHLNSDLNQRQNTEQKKNKSENLKISANRYVKLCGFGVESIVLARQKYSCPWPAKVLKIEAEKVFVYFFGDRRNGYVNKSEIYDFVLSSNAIKNTLKSKKIQQTYVTGIREVEMLMGIAHE